ANSFVPLADAIQRPEPILIVERRGRGASDGLGHGYSVETEVADLRAWIDDLGQPVYLYGWSYGATIAIEAAAKDRRVLCTVAYEPVLRPFGRSAIPRLIEADPDERVRIINVDISGLSHDQFERLRFTPEWESLK